MIIELLLELKNNINEHGVRWGVVFAFYAIFRKEKRNYRLDIRDRVHNAYFAAILANQREIMKGMGVDGCFVDVSSLSPDGAEKSLQKLREVIYRARSATSSIHPRGIGKLNSRRTKKVQSRWMNPSLLAVVIGFGVTYLNAQFGLHLNTVQIVGILTAIAHYAVAQEIVHAKRLADGSFAGYTFNSSKLIMVVLSSLAIGFCERAGIEANPADISAFVALSVSFVTGKAYYDVKKTSEPKRANYDPNSFQ